MFNWNVNYIYILYYLLQKVYIANKEFYDVQVSIKYFIDSLNFSIEFLFIILSNLVALDKILLGTLISSTKNILVDLNVYTNVCNYFKNLYMIKKIL